MPTTVEALLVFVFVVVPGYVTLRVSTSRAPSTAPSGLELVLISLFYGLLVHAVLILSGYTDNVIDTLGRVFSDPRGIFHEENRSTTIHWLIVVFGVAPLGLGAAIAGLREIEFVQFVLSYFGMSRVQKTPTAWDWFYLSQKDGCWVIAEYEDGTKIAGVYGTSSFASLTPYSRDLYLERGYSVENDGSIGDELPDNIGIWLDMEKVRNIRFHRSGDA